jgi:hypothetical protein
MTSLLSSRSNTQERLEVPEEVQPNLGAHVGTPVEGFDEQQIDLAQRGLGFAKYHGDWENHLFGQTILWAYLQLFAGRGSGARLLETISRVLVFKLSRQDILGASCSAFNRCGKSSKLG